MKNALGYAAILMIQAATIPAVLKALETPDAIPLMMPLLLVAGMFLLLIRAIQDKDNVYIISNGIGFMLNILLLSVVIL